MQFYFPLACERGLEERVIFIRSGGEFVSLSMSAVPSAAVSKLIWKSENRVVAKLKSEDITVYRDRASLFPNGTLDLHKPDKNDRGAFYLEGFDAGGKCMFRGRIQLEVQDPVSVPTVSMVSCDSGHVELMCEVERGDNVSFWWNTSGGSLDSNHGVTTERGHLLSVRTPTMGEVVCTAYNNVSMETSTPIKPDCHACKKGLAGRVIFIRSRVELVSLSLPTVPSAGVSKLIWKSENRVVAKLKSEDITVYRDRANLFPNGTLVLHKPDKKDRGTFQMEGFDAGGKCMFSGSIQLEVQDAVSTPAVSMVSCDSGRVELRCKVVCMAYNNVNMETSTPIKPDCHGGFFSTYMTVHHVLWAVITFLLTLFILHQCKVLRAQGTPESSQHHPVVLTGSEQNLKEETP
ncbi:hypothetical protein MATL_G00173800 [Megalops atlanticus]|uniref:Ig-like domain-containing protein n=1 Tax=Megalops atlanticus TaxID=7932 RepID=A0A9D3PRM6_MEGAT|nr:hypothetical protein MATL_G00173800 [Megalops atlanticus]